MSDWYTVGFGFNSQPYKNKKIYHIFLVYIGEEALTSLNDKAAEEGCLQTSKQKIAPYPNFSNHFCSLNQSTRYDSKLKKKGNYKKTCFHLSI